MNIPENVYKEISFALYHTAKIKQELEDLKEEIIYSHSKDVVTFEMNTKSYIPDPTFDCVVKILNNRTLQRKEALIKIIQRLFEKDSVAKNLFANMHSSRIKTSDVKKRKMRKTYIEYVYWQMKAKGFF